MRLLIVFLTAPFSMVALAERYYEDEACAREKPKKITPFNNWNNTMRRWSRGKGAWDNWRDWRRPTSKDKPFATLNDAMSDCDFRYDGRYCR